MIRFFDILFSLIGLAIISPLIILLSIAIKIESKGPVFFKQIRIGLNGNPFKLYKFRSMYENSERKGQITIGSNDKRITRVGRFIRKYKMDELPQLFNVFKGDMSLVGPRPEVPKYVEKYSEYQMRVLSVRPGITDYASIYFSNENDILAHKDNPEEYYVKFLIPQKIRLNMIYIKNYNILVYFKIIFTTIRKIFT